MADAPSLGVRVYANVDELKKALRDGTAEIATTTGAMEKLSTSLRGDKLIQNANNITASVLNIGGASKLTEAEQARVNATLDKAIQKYELMGKTAPSAMKELYEATKKVPETADAANTSLDKIWGGLKSAAGLAGIAFSVGSVVSFTTKIFDAAEGIKDMSDRLGVGIEAAQRFKYAAEQGGGSVEDVEKAIATMNRTLADGDKSTVAALSKAGLQFADIRQMSPEKAFSTIADAIGKIEDPMTRAQVAQELFGKSALKLLPSMIEGFKKLGDETDVMADKTVKRLEAAKQTWENFWNSITVHSAEALASLMNTSSKSAGAMSVLVGGYAGTTGKAIEAAEAHRQAASGLKDVHLAAEPLVKKILPELTEGQKKAAEQAKAHADKLREMADVYSGKALNAKLKEMNDALLLSDKVGGPAVQQMGKLVAEYQRMEREGGILQPRQQALIRQYRELDLGTRTLSNSTEALTVDLAVTTKVFWDTHSPIEGFNQRLSASVGGINELMPKLKELGDRYHSDVTKTVVAPKTDGWAEWSKVADREISSIVMAAKRGSEGILLYASGFARDFVSTSLDILVPGLGQIVTLAWPLIEAGLAKIWDGIQAFWGKVKGIFNFFGQGTGAQTPTGDFNPNDPNNPFYGREDPGNPNPTPRLPEGEGTGNLYVPSDGLTPHEEYLRQRKIVYGFAGGTGGKYLDFGTGQPVVLHGKERVMTEAEGRASATGNDDMVRELRALLGELNATFSTLPHMLATQLAGQLAMVRR